MERKHKNDLILIAAVIFIATVCFLLVKGVPGKKNDLKQSKDIYVLITSDGETIIDKSVSELDMPYTIEVSSDDGGINIFTINISDDGSPEISCTEADCPDKICVEQGRVKLVDEPIVCLPHKAIAKMYEKFN